MPISQEVKEIKQFDWWRARVRPLGLHTSAQSPKVKGFQSAYMAILLALLVPRIWPLGKSLGTPRMEIYALVKRPNFFPIKYSKSLKKTHIIYFN